MPAPLIEFAQFAHPQRWWLRRGSPPWLEEPRWWVRAFRVSLVLGAMGSVSGWLTVFVSYALRRLESQFGGMHNSELLLLLGPGLWFGLGTLLPLSRWLGRGWIMSLLALPASVVACYGGIFTMFFASPIMSSGPSPLPWGKEGPGFYAGFAGAFLVAVWMGHPLRKSAWLAVLLASGLGSLCCGVVLLNILSWDAAVFSSGMREFLDPALLYVGFQSLTAVGLGARLWWKGESM